MDTPIVPNIAGLTDLVYEPAEDSFLLLDALEKDLPAVIANNAFNDEIVYILEVGCGSGLVSTAIAKSEQFLGGRIPCVFAADINPYACVLTEKTGNANKVIGSNLHTVLIDGRFTFGNPFRMEFDLIVCNPPYVPIQSGENTEDEKSGILQKSWDGGSDGNEFIVPFLDNVTHLMKSDGNLYLLLSSWNNPGVLVENIARKKGLAGTQIMNRAAGRERLSVWKFQKTS